MPKPVASAVPVTVAPPTTLKVDQIFLFVVLIALEGLHFVFARLLEGRLPSQTAAAAYVMSAAALEVAIFAAITGKFNWQTARRHAWFFVAIGFCVGFSTLLSYESVIFIDPGIASVLAKLTSLFNVIFGLIWLHERLNRQQLLGGLVAILGAVIIVFEPNDYFRWGSLLVVVSSLLYAIHAFLVKKYGGGIEFVEFFLFRLLSTAGFLLLFTALRQALTWPDWTTWGYLILVGSIDVTFSRTLYYLTMRRIPLSLHSILLTLSPVAAVIFTLILFGTFPTAQQLLGGLLVLAGVGLVTLRR